MRKLRTLLILTAIVLTSVIYTGCTPDSSGALGEPATASFTMTPVAGRVNTYVLQSTSIGAWGFQWDKGTGTYVKGKETDTAYFPTKGAYTVKLRAFGNGGHTTAEQSVDITVDDIVNNAQFKLLTATKWKLDASDGANAIIVGTEGNPGQYSPGGPLADCQKDDVYTFGADFKLSYEANGSTFNAGNLSPNYTCSGDRSYSNVTYTFQPGVAGGAGIATITTPGTPPANFIGVTDPSSNTYRIISISATEMVLRSGTASETVHQFKFVPHN
ncbi:MAG: hypothetical protein EOO04_05095 [Chitinophagaceae bacterium]|nr:MAG: hypothetical protein EOO04_05095 [Chitinophagaceae bacterium]